MFPLLCYLKIWNILMIEPGMNIIYSPTCVCISFITNIGTYIQSNVKQSLDLIYRNMLFPLYVALLPSSCHINLQREYSRRSCTVSASFQEKHVSENILKWNEFIKRRVAHIIIEIIPVLHIFLVSNLDLLNCVVTD